MIKGKVCTDVRNVLKIETVEEAKEHANDIKISASELIDAGNFILTNADQ